MDCEKEIKWDLSDMTLKEFFKSLSSPKLPSPTGGSACIVSALCAINLLLMVLQINLNNKERQGDSTNSINYAQKGDSTDSVNYVRKGTLLDSVDYIRFKLKEANNRLLALMEQDIVVMQKSFVQDNREAEEGQCLACETLAEVLEVLCEVLELIPHIRGINKRKALTCDLGAAYWLLEGAVRGTSALLRSDINQLDDSNQQIKLEATLNDLVYRVEHALKHR